MLSLACPLLLWQRSFGVTRIILSCHGYVSALVCSLWKPWEGFFSLVQEAMNMQADVTIFCFSLLLLSSPYFFGCAIWAILDWCSFWKTARIELLLFIILVNRDMWCSLAGHISETIVMRSMIISFNDYFYLVDDFEWNWGFLSLYSIGQ